jgi:hypothetical protein
MTGSILDHNVHNICFDPRVGTWPRADHTLHSLKPAAKAVFDPCLISHRPSRYMINSLISVEEYPIFSSRRFRLSDMLTESRNQSPETYEASLSRRLSRLRLCWHEWSWWPSINAIHHLDWLVIGLFGSMARGPINLSMVGKTDSIHTYSFGMHKKCTFSWSIVIGEVEQHHRENAVRYSYFDGLYWFNRCSCSRLFQTARRLIWILNCKVRGLQTRLDSLR